MSPAMAPRICLTIVSGVGFAHRRTESLITRVSFSVGVSEQGKAVSDIERLVVNHGQWLHGGCGQNSYQQLNWAGLHRLLRLASCTGVCQKQDREKDNIK